MLLFNLLVIIGMAWQLFNSPAWKWAPDRPASPAVRGILIAVLLILSLLKLAWIYSLQLLALKLLDRPRPAGLKAAFGAVGGILLVMSGAGWVSSLGEAQHAFVFTMFSVFEFVALTAVIATAIALIVGAGHSEDVRIRKAVSAFGWIYLGLFSSFINFLATLGVRARHGPRAGKRRPGKSLSPPGAFYPSTSKAEGKSQFLAPTCPRPRWNIPSGPTRPDTMTSP